jgi:hypothetical protein
MPPNRKHRPARDRTALRVFSNNSNAPAFNPAIDLKQEVAEFERLADCRFRRKVERLHRLKTRVLYELLVELGAKHLIQTDIEQMVERYADLDIDLLKALGADRFPPSSPWLVAGDGR